jgi:hypothetical protein
VRRRNVDVVSEGQDTFSLTIPAGRDAEIPTDAVFAIRGLVADRSGNIREFEEVFPATDIRREANLASLSVELRPLPFPATPRPRSCM